MILPLVLAQEEEVIESASDTGVKVQLTIPKNHQMFVGREYRFTCRFSNEQPWALGHWVYINYWDASGNVIKNAGHTGSPKYYSLPIGPFYEEKTIYVRCEVFRSAFIFGAFPSSDSIGRCPNEEDAVVIKVVKKSSVSDIVWANGKIAQLKVIKAKAENAGKTKLADLTQQMITKFENYKSAA